MMSRAIKLMGLLAAAVVALAACGSQGGAAGGAAGGGATLYFYNWGDYIDPTLLEKFQAESGVSVVVDTFEANEPMIAKVRAGGSGYDVVVPTDYAVQVMATDGLLAPLDKGQLSNLGNLDPALMGLYFDKTNTYSVPYIYGTTGIAYSRKAFPDGVDSWAALFDPAQLEKVRGKASMLDDEREAPGAALHYLGESLNSTDPAMLDQAKGLLLAQKPFLATYNSSNFQRLLASGEYVIAQAYNGDALLARRGLEEEFSGNPDIAFVIPKEGGTIWMDNLAILAESPNKAAAHKFIDFMLRPDIAARNAEYVGYPTPNKAAREQVSEEMVALYAEGFAPDENTYDRLEWIERNAGAEVFSELWAQVKGQ
ncbi:MAG: spermidine/putrescine ABC transporter substrate-binding protein [Chloroflexales bacterium]|nr:spermidine/putrescine ABC transporter substrate-binding protein [Chloroflexales bacterium]